MKVVSLNCNHCAAPLEVSAKARFATCGFCNAKLAIEHTGSTYSTSVLEELKDKTDQIARDVAAIKSSNEVSQLDAKWQRERAQHIVTGKHGNQHLPTKNGAIVAGVGICGFGLFWTIMAAGMTSGATSMGAPGVIRVFPLFGVIFMIVGGFSAYSMYTKADAFERANNAYLRKRRQLARKQNEPS